MARPRKAATPSQVQAIHAIARQQTPTWSACCATSYGVARPEDLSLSEASRLIDDLKAAGAV